MDTTSTTAKSIAYVGAGIALIAAAYLISSRIHKRYEDDRAVAQLQKPLEQLRTSLPTAREASQWPELRREKVQDSKHTAYRWKDSAGTWHLSDKQPEGVTAEAIPIR